MSRRLKAWERHIFTFQPPGLPNNASEKVWGVWKAQRELPVLPQKALHSFLHNTVPAEDFAENNEGGL